MENHNSYASGTSLDAVPQDGEAPPSYFTVINGPKPSSDVPNGSPNLYSDYTVSIPITATTQMDVMTNYLLNDSGIEYSSVNETVLEPLTSTTRAVPSLKTKWDSKRSLLMAAVLIGVCVVAALSVSLYNTAKLQQVSGKMAKDHEDLQTLKMLVGNLGEKFTNVSDNLMELDEEFRNISATWLDASEKIKTIDKTILQMLEQVEVKYEDMGKKTVDYLEDLKMQRSFARQLRPDGIRLLIVCLVLANFFSDLIYSKELSQNIQ